jgi:hypothetical protein
MMEALKSSNFKLLSTQASLCSSFSLFKPVSLLKLLSVQASLYITYS